MRTLKGPDLLRIRALAMRPGGDLFEEGRQPIAVAIAPVTASRSVRFSAWIVDELDLL
jgi:hypothetical protein